MEPRGSGEDSFGAGSPSDHRQWLLRAPSASSLFSLDDELPGDEGAWILGCQPGGMQNGVGTWLSQLRGGYRRSVSEALFLESVCGMMIVYVLRCLRIKSGWKEASSTLRPCGKHFSPAGSLAGE